MDTIQIDMDAIKADLIEQYRKTTTIFAPADQVAKLYQIENMIKLIKKYEIKGK